MISPTRQEELQQFFTLAMPGFLEYVRTHQTAIEQVELATVKEGIVSFPATQILGGVQKTVRVPLTVITADIDAESQYAKDMGDYAKAKGDYAKTQGDYAKTQGDYAKDEGDYALAQGTGALAAKNTVTEWFAPFKTTAEDFYNDTMLGLWQPWYTSFKSAAETWYTPFKNTAEAWYADILIDWAAFYTNGAVPAWAQMTADYQSDHTRAAFDHTQADADHTASVNATNEASNVNATLVGMTVTITDRNGQSNSTNIGFEIYRTYASVAAMNADAANVPQGKFVMIATQDPTDPDNAQLWGRNNEPATAEHPFTFLSDLDQASTSAWADWMNNQKPLIIAATNAANTAAATATQQGNTAEAQGNTAEGKGDYAKGQGDRAKAWADHPPYIADGTQEKPGDLNYWYIYDETTDSYVQDAYAKGDDLHWDEMSQAEKDELADSVLDRIIVASVETCESIIDELI